MRQRRIETFTASFGVVVVLLLLAGSPRSSAFGSERKPRSFPTDSLPFDSTATPADTSDLGLGPDSTAAPADTSDLGLDADSTAAPPDTSRLGIGTDSSTVATQSLITELEGDLSDSSRVRIEIGASSDLTNEQFYETDYTDPNFKKRTLVSTPESQMAGVLFTSVAGTRSRRAITYQLQNQLSVGDKVQQGLLSLQWRHDLDPSWRYQVLPRIEYRHDRTFDRDLEEWRASAGTRLRRQMAEHTWTAELGANTEILRSSGFGSDLLLDRQLGEISLTLDRLPLVGPEARIGYRFALRAFPDSLTRDHWEHGWEGRWKKTFSSGHSVLVEANGARRQTRRIVTTSRDNFWEIDGALEGEARFSEASVLRARIALETMKYDLEDDLLFFNYQVARARLGPRVERGPFALTLESRGEALFAPLSEGEEYREVGGAFEIEYLAAHAWWSLTPAAGWRDYSEAASEDSLDIGLHSSFAFYELGAIADQALPGQMRLRLFANARYESHVDAAQDARSLYFSLDVRRLF
jgi:hypothetical protein